VVKRLGAAGLEVGTPASIDEQRVPGKDVTGGATSPDKAHAARGMPRRAESFQDLTAKFQGAAVLQLNRCRADAASCGGSGQGASVLGQLGCAGDVVSVGMGFKRPAQLQAVFLEHMQITLELLVHRVDDQGLARNVVEEDVGVGAGDRIKKLDWWSKGVHQYLIQCFQAGA